MSDLVDKRRRYNRKAQRSYRAHLKSRFSNIERDSKVPSDPDVEGNVEETSEAEEAPGSNDAAYIQCLCGEASDSHFLVRCIKCGNEQHIACYYESAADIMDNHV
jgi:hypothetical protein